MLAWLRTTALILLTVAGTARADNRLGHDSVSAEDRVGPAGATNNETLRRELDSFKAVPVSLRKALAAVQGLRAGSRAVDISFDGTADPPVYRVKTSQGDLVWQDAIDARIGSTLGTASKSSIGELGQQDQRALFELRSVRQGIMDAVIVAERNTSGTAISAGIMMDAGRLSFVVVCVSGSDLKQVILEPPPITGHVRRRHVVR